MLREDDVTQLEFNASGLISRSKPRRLLLLNDLLVCVAVNGRSSEVDSSGVRFYFYYLDLGDFNASFSNDFQVNSTSSSANERLTLKWAVPVSDVEVIDGAAGGTLARVLAYGGGGGSMSSGSGTTSKRSSLTRSVTPNHLGLSSLTLSGGGNASPAEKESKESSGQAENLAQDMHDLMHDYDVVSRIAGLIGSLKGSYEVRIILEIPISRLFSICFDLIFQGLDTSVTSKILSDIQSSIRQKDEEMSWVDACCLQFAIKTGKGSRGSESCTFQTRDPNVKKEWIVGKYIIMIVIYFGMNLTMLMLSELRLAQLALDPNNSPGWDVLEQERSVSTKMPLYVKSFLVCQNKMRQTEVSCGASYTLLIQTPTRTQRPQT